MFQEVQWLLPGRRLLKELECADGVKTLSGKVDKYFS